MNEKLAGVNTLSPKLPSPAVPFKKSFGKPINELNSDGKLIATKKINNRNLNNVIFLSLNTFL